MLFRISPNGEGVLPLPTSKSTPYESQSPNWKGRADSQGTPPPRRDPRIGLAHHPNSIPRNLTVLTANEGCHTKVLVAVQEAPAMDCRPPQPCQQSPSHQSYRDSMDCASCWPHRVLRSRSQTGLGSGQLGVVLRWCLDFGLAHHARVTKTPPAGAGA